MQVEDLGGQIQQNGGLPHHQGQDTKPRQVTSVQVRNQMCLFSVHWKIVFSEVIASVCAGETESSAECVWQDCTETGGDKFVLFPPHSCHTHQTIFNPSINCASGWWWPSLVIIRPHSFHHHTPQASQGSSTEIKCKILDDNVLFLPTLGWWHCQGDQDVNKWTMGGDKHLFKSSIEQFISSCAVLNSIVQGELNGKVGHFPFTHVEFIDRWVHLVEIYFPTGMFSMFWQRSSHVGFIGRSRNIHCHRKTSEQPFQNPPAGRAIWEPHSIASHYTVKKILKFYHFKSNFQNPPCPSTIQWL